MSNVKCLGSESDLDKCSFTWAAEGECNHSGDVVVDCYGGNATEQPSTLAKCEVSQLQQLQELLTQARDQLCFLNTKLSSRYFLFLVLWNIETQVIRSSICHVAKQNKELVLCSLLTCNMCS